MSSLHHVASAAHRAGNASAVTSAGPAHQFQNDPVTVRRLLSSIGAQLGAAWRLICRVEAAPPGSHRPPLAQPARHPGFLPKRGRCRGRNEQAVLARIGD